MIQKKTLLGLTLCLFGLILFSAQSQPIQNPYKLKYGGPAHWTDSLKWSMVYNISDFSGLPDDDLDDSSAIQTAINTVHANGGGVIFFPPGTYRVDGMIRLKSGVILRGAPSAVNDAKNQAYAPPSKLVFPKFELDTAASNGQGNDRQKAFKGIESEYSCSNIGLVDLDINRAYIAFKPQFNPNPGAPFNTPQAIEKNRNIIVMGIRSNNAVILDPNIPILGNPAGSQQRAWQLFPWRFSANIDVYAFQNCVIANNRLNDGPFDNFDMPNFKIRQRNTSNWITLGLRSVGSGWKASFDYNAHYGISLNRAKIYKDTAGKYRIHGVATYANPENEPDLFRSGFEILDNWVYKTSRVGITAAGIGLVIKGNITRDEEGKDSPAKENFTGPTATQTPQGATTLENRGIDFSGWQVRVDSNDVICYRNYVQGYLSTDGEGILLQECCGGTQVNDYTISGNIVRNYIGIYKMRDINNLKILNNNLFGNTIYVVANTNNDAHFLNNFIIDGNTNVGSITATGTRGGFGGYIRNNTGTGGSVNLSCHVNFETSNNGFGSIVYRAVDPNNLVNHTPPVVSGYCGETTTYPKVWMSAPAADTTFDNSMTQYTLRAKLVQGDIFTAKIDFLRGTEVVAADLSVNPSDSTALYVWNVPQNVTNVTPFTARVRDQDLTSFSEVRVFTRITPILTVKSFSVQNGWKVFPNPVSYKQALYIQSTQKQLKPLSLVLHNLQGKTYPLPVRETSEMDIFTYEANLSSLPRGIYFLILNNRERFKLVVE